tara:strand:- start:356 stop:613 length:258 start_codon:yes stop_codon:yes gene_type:complete
MAMKTLTRTGSNISLYIFEDNKYLDINEDTIVVGDPADFIIADCNSGNTLLHQNVTPPSDWTGNKYTYVDGVWANNPSYVDLSQE